MSLVRGTAGGRRRLVLVVAAVAALAVAASLALSTLRTAPAPAPAPSPSGGPASPEAGADAPVAVFIGDSYTVGAGSEIAGSGFPAILGEARGWQVVNLAVSGTGYVRAHAAGYCPEGGCPAYAGVIDDAVAADPDVVVVSGGRNDLGLEDIDAAVADFFQQLRAALPEPRIVVTSPLWDDSATPPELVAMRETVARESQRVGAELVDLGDLFAGRPELIAPDDLHPNAAGLRLIAERIDEALGPG